MFYQAVIAVASVAVLCPDHLLSTCVEFELKVIVFDQIANQSISVSAKQVQGGMCV